MVFYVALFVRGEKKTYYTCNLSLLTVFLKSFILLRSF